VIDAHLAPAVLGLDASRFEAAAAAMNRAAKRNNAAKGAIESALFDAVGRTLGVPAVQLLGGTVREKMPVYWTLASGDPAQEIEEAEGKLAACLHDRFKIKIGAQPLTADLARLAKLAAALGARATLIVDANQAWDEATANRAMPALADLGIALVEQPLPAWNVDGLARVRQSSAVPIMADECVFDAHDALRVAATGAADVLSLKIVKHGGPLALRRVAAVAEAGGLALYGGCLLESSIGAAAHLHAFAGLPSLAWGCEHFGPHILTEDLVAEPLRIADFHIHLPSGPGLGVTLDADRLRRFARV
jgi:muconate cycloisomerase